MRSPSFRVFCLVLSNVFTLSIAQLVPRIFEWELTETNYTRLGVQKPILTVNGEFPGPTLHLTYGEKVQVNVTNKTPYGVTIHWHGVKQPGNPWSDGPEYVTQCPIKPGNSYTYVIQLSDEEGTLWWHAHSDWSRATIYGAMYISPKNGIAPYGQPDGEFPIILGAWFNGNLTSLLEQHLNGGSPSLLDANALTINGQTGNQISNTSDADVYTMNVESGKTYLLRFICNTMTEEMYVAVANHNLTVVGVDGAYVQNFTSDYIFITPGQTVDVLINTDQDPGQYYMFGRALNSPGAITPIVNALLNYTDQPGDINDPYIPTTTLPERTNISASYNFTAQLRHIISPDYPVNLPNPENVTRIIINSVAIVRNAALNNIHFVFPKIDILQAYFNGTDGVYTADFPLSSDQDSDPITNGTRVFEVEYNTTVELVFQSFGGQGFVQANHPMHLHGYSFYLLGSKDNANFSASVDPLESYNLVDPPLINTISLPLRGWAAVRFRADNPGVWFMHCHLEKHASWGMETVMIVKDGTGAGEQMISPPLGIIAPC